MSVRMKQIILSFLLLGIWLVSGLSVAEALDDADALGQNSLNTVPGIQVDDEMVQILNQNLGSLFPITSIREYFNEPAAAVYTDDGPATVIRIENERGKRNISIFANADSVHDYIGYSAIDDAYPSNFYMTMDVTPNDVYPAGQGGCFVGFTEYGYSALSEADNAMMVSLLTDGANPMIFVKENSADAGSRYALSSSLKGSAKLSVIHLTGHTYVLINGMILGQFHDGKKGPFRLIFGAAVFPDGDTADCTFDNLVIRKLSGGS